MRLVVGLGNPGNEYNCTRHNIGFMFLDYIIGNDKFKLNKKFNALECEMVINAEKIMFIKPLSFMNLSGEVVLKYVKFYKIDFSNILIIHDDLDMEMGRYKLMFNHGDGGHNGIKNIIFNLNSREFLRLKFGISKALIDTKEYVLGNFSKSELRKVEDTFSNFNSFIDDYVSLSRDLLIGKYNSKNKANM